MNDKEQLEFCEILDNWYFESKSHFSGIHPLGMRKEDLKKQVCEWLETKKFVEEKPFEFVPLKKFCECRQCLVCHIIDVNTCNRCNKTLRECQCEEQN